VTSPPAGTIRLEGDSFGAGGVYAKRNRAISAPNPSAWYTEAIPSDSGASGHLAKRVDFVTTVDVTRFSLLGEKAMMGSDVKEGGFTPRLMVTTVPPPLAHDDGTAMAKRTSDGLGVVVGWCVVVGVREVVGACDDGGV
jgi:hypothetical protein